MSRKVNIFGVNFDNLTIEQIARLALEIMRQKGEKPLVIFTPNPEIVMEAQKNKGLFIALESADIIAPDGVGIVWASKYFGERIEKRASGYDIVQEIFAIGGEIGGFTAYFLGGREETVIKAAKKMGGMYSALNIVGVRDGYFKDTEAVVNDINAVTPDLLLVGLGSPKQELWVQSNVEKLKVKVIIVVGGSFDVMSGNIKRAPELFRKMGIEWLYRLITQPKRFFRMLRLPLFAFKVLFCRKRKR